MSQEALNSLDGAVKRLVDREVSISQNDRQRASTTQNYLRQVLRAKSQYDDQFPFLLEKSDDDFLGGSFARHTKIWPLDDIDLYIPLDGSQLIYHNNGVRLPFVVWSDDHSRINRLISHDKWMTGTNIDPQKLLRGLKQAVGDTYPTSTTTLHAQAVNLQLSVAANVGSEGISLDIVPCFHLSPMDNSEQFYVMPNHSGGWMRTNPRKDNKLSQELHAYHNRTYRKAIRLVKYWNATRMNGAFSSYYLELAICKKFEAFRAAGTSIASNTIALYFAFEAVRDSFQVGNIEPLIQGAPVVEAPMLGTTQRERLNGVVGLVGSSYHSAFTASNITVAQGFLQQLFNVSVE
jgi:hypothetical protein